ncbi:MAG: aldehyde dehydrogenase family protein, partial [Pseudomonadota bacterium]
HELTSPADGTFVPPTLIRVNGITDLETEVFGPVLHIATFAADEIDHVINEINATGYGLTFGLHTRIDDRVEAVTQRIRAGNIYVNRNQIGAVVGSQPFGGMGLSGTGPKAGGPNYVPRFFARGHAADGVEPAPMHLPGPTGEANTLHHRPKAPILCAGPGEEAIAAQIDAVRALGGTATRLAPAPDPDELRDG